ncbi:DUF6541 family protein [Corynebacterium caspium]|uniref:DUF6541 family protein n=1 Tax=Corynebacterium caspium TaxID=234828 RepID=UPI000377B2BF|nr:DUF6541 family protein [Corynebacterium caspium]WKD59813.1 hypothetical protein CCASP_07170 [Corynebacterium caspium DSM 44850]
MGLLAICLVALLIIFLPGIIIGFLSGLNWLWAISAAIPISFGFYGFSAWALGADQGANRLTKWALFLFVWVIAALIWRWFMNWRGIANSSFSRAKPIALDPKRQRNFWWTLPALGCFLGTLSISLPSFRWLLSSPHGLENIFQGWDVQWHANVIRWISETGQASPNAMGLLQNQETHSFLYYPSAWHAGTYFLLPLTGISPIAAVNIMSIILPAVALPLSVALLAWRISGSHGITAYLAATISPILVVLIPALYWVGYYVGAWPYVAAISLLGIVIALFMSIPTHPQRSFAAMLALLGLVQIHPSAITVVVVALGLWWLCWQVWQPIRRDLKPFAARLRDFAWLFLAGGAGLVLFFPQLLAGVGQSEEVAAYKATEDISRSTSWVRALLMQTRHVEEFGHISMGWLIVPAVVGLVFMVGWRRNLWAPLLYAFSLLLTVHSLVPVNGVLGKVLTVFSNMHYNTGHRLIMPVAMLFVAAAGLGVAVLVRILCGAPLEQIRGEHLGGRPQGALHSWVRWSRPFSAVLALAASLGILGILWPQVRSGAHWAVDSLRTDGRMVDDADRRAWDWLAKQPGAYEGYIMGEPADGNGWMYAYNGLPALIRHYSWPHADAESNTDLLFWRANLLGAGNRDNPDEANRIDTAAAELNVKFYYISPPNFWIFQPPNWSMIEGLSTSRGATMVYKDAQVTIFAVNAAFTDTQLTAMRTSSPTELPPLTPAQAEINPIDPNDIHYHRPLVSQQPGAGQLLETGSNIRGGLLREDAVEAGLGSYNLKVKDGISELAK